MTRIYTFERDPYRRDLEAEVIATGRSGGRPFAILDDTIFYPEGGGQPADQGRLGATRVLDVGRVDGAIRHLLDSAVETGPVRLELDWRRRFDHMQQHTAQHLLTAIALERFGWPTTAFHLRAEASDIELGTAEILPSALDELEEAVAEEIRAHRTVTTRRVSPREYDELEVRSRGLPSGHRGDIRLVEIEGIDLNTCGGTHLRSTGEIESVKLLGTESLRGGTRIHWIAGGRVRRRLAEHEARNAELRKLLRTRDEELVAVAGLKLDQLQEASRRQKQLEKQLAEAVAESLARRRDPVVEEHFEAADMSFLQRVGRRFGEARPAGLAFLTAAGPQGSLFVVAAGGECSHDVAAAGRRVADALSGRGGGAGQLFQGKTASLERRAAAFEDLVTLVASADS